MHVHIIHSPDHISNQSMRTIVRTGSTIYPPESMPITYTHQNQAYQCHTPPSWCSPSIAVPGRLAYAGRVGAGVEFGRVVVQVVDQHRNRCRHAFLRYPVIGDHHREDEHVDEFTVDDVNYSQDARIFIDGDGY